MPNIDLSKLDSVKKVVHSVSFDEYEVMGIGEFEFKKEYGTTTLNDLRLVIINPIDMVNHTSATVMAEMFALEYVDITNATAEDMFAFRLSNDIEELIARVNKNTKP